MFREWKEQIHVNVINIMDDFEHLNVVCSLV